MVFTCIIYFISGLALGLSWNAKKQAKEALDNFVRNQHLRDENAVLKKQVEQLQKNLNEHGII